MVTQAAGNPIPATAKPAIVTPAAGNQIPVTGTVHVVNSMNPYPSIMPVTVTNFATPTVNQSIMIGCLTEEWYQFLNNSQFSSSLSSILPPSIIKHQQQL
ncbi:hypothetical protein LSTR_LSTR012585 [Laodelphax striatellus]|uniref:Uncharacterized protein n=1 Tax=Laodelphax striatellus TaxID=195883 RepID=A0A482XAX1_LAOST|nr:hypothetical protein LSTR_LSTR012585 [Laodelphax striatellus]